MKTLAESWGKHEAVYRKADVAEYMIDELRLSYYAGAIATLTVPPDEQGRVLEEASEYFCKREQ